MSLDFSVIIPHYNRHKMLREAVESVLDQKYSLGQIELIIVDDGSDPPLNENDFTAPAVKLINLSFNQGVSKARNEGIKEASYEWIALLDSDDLWHKKKLQRIGERILEDAQNAYSLYHSQEKWLRHGKHLNQKKIHQKGGGDQFERSLELCVISPSAVCFKKSVFMELGCFDENFKVCEDYDLWLRWTSQYEVGFIDEILITKRGGHDDQLSHSRKGFDHDRLKACYKLLQSPLCLTTHQRELTLNWFDKRFQLLSHVYEKHALKEDLEEIIELKQNIETGPVNWS